MFKNLVTLIERVDDEAAGRLGGDTVGQEPSSLAAGGDVEAYPHAAESSLVAAAASESTASLPRSVTAPPNILTPDSSNPVMPAEHNQTPQQLILSAPEGCVGAVMDGAGACNAADTTPLSAPFRRIAELECELRMGHVKNGVLQQDILRVHRDLDIRHDLLQRLACALRQHSKASGKHGQEVAELCCEVETVAAGGDALPSNVGGDNYPHLISAGGLDACASPSLMRQLEHSVRYHQEAQNNLRECNIALREQLLKDEAAMAAEREQWAQQWGPLSAQAERSVHLTKEVERRKEEALHAWTRMSSLQTALREATEKRDAAVKETEALRRVVLLRDEELLSLRMNSGGAGRLLNAVAGESSTPLPTVATSRVVLAAEKKWFGPPLKRSILSLDRICLFVGRALYRYAWLRLFVVVYFVVLHVHMFHVVTMVVHGMPHNGDDVHAYLKHHMQ